MKARSYDSTASLVILHRAFPHKFCDESNRIENNGRELWLACTNARLKRKNNLSKSDRRALYNSTRRLLMVFGEGLEETVEIARGWVAKEFRLGGFQSWSIVIIILPKRNTCLPQVDGIFLQVADSRHRLDPETHASRGVIPTLFPYCEREGARTDVLVKWLHFVFYLLKVLRNMADIFTLRSISLPAQRGFARRGCLQHAGAS